MSDETVETRRGDQWIAVTNLRMRTLLERNPHVRVLFPVFVIQLDVVLELIFREDVLQYAVAFSLKKSMCIGLPWLVGSDITSR